MPNFVDQTDAERFRWLETNCVMVELVKTLQGTFLCVDFIDFCGIYRQVKVGLRFGTNMLLKMCEQIYIWQTAGGFEI